MTKRGKRYLEAEALIDRETNYEPREAIALAKRTATAKFDESVELHLRTGADPRHADQMVRGVAILPHGAGKTIRTLVFAQGETVTAALDAGADHAGGDDLIKKIEDGWLEFDVSIATPDMMGRIGKLGRILGRRGLMPNPRIGTVVQPDEIPRAIAEAKKGRVEYRLDRTSLIHVTFGKVSFEEDQLMDNLTSVMDNILRSRPGGIKGQFIRTAYLTTSMGPSIGLDVASASALRIE